MLKRSSFNGLAGPALMILAAAVLGGGCNFLYQMYMGKSLSPDLYSELASVLSLFYILTIPSLLVTTTVLRYVSTYQAEGRQEEIAWLLRRSFVVSVIIGIVMMALMLLLSPWLSSFLHIAHGETLIILAAGAFLLMLGPVAVGGAQALGMFGALSLYNLVGPLLKLVLAIALVTFGLGVGGAFGGAVAGTILAFWVVIWALRDHWRREGKRPDTSGMMLYTVPVAVATISFTFITNMDTFLARGLLSEFDAGLYSSASMLGKIVLWLPGAITTVTFARFAAGGSKGDESQALIRHSLLIVGAVLALIVAIFVLFPDQILRLIYQDSYVDAGPCLPTVIAAFALFGLASVYMNYGLARNDPVYVFILAIFTVIGTFLVLMYHQSPLQLGQDMLFASAGICVTSELYMELRWRRKRRNISSK
ncbi:MAG: Polysaccharide biosynthesis protein [Methanomassiliicoccales archaeon PtaU1.Bin124]|nr:MAG: Polysaccharide biosynthesis protein [Methanomassiliicoccales archaeon PtaU1.Bin124]